MRGKGLFLFAMLVALGNLRFASTPRCRSLPAFYSMTIVGAGGLSTRVGNAMMRLREGTGRKFGNMILTNISTHPGIRIETCTQSSTDTPSALPTMSLNTYLFFTSKNIIESPTAGFSIMSPRTDTVPSICSNECFYTSNAARDNGAPGCECDLHRALFIFDAFSTAPTFATRASSDQVECKLNVFAEHTSASPPSPELDALNPYMSPEPKLMATEPDSPYMPYNPAVMRRHQGNFSLAHTEKRSYWYRELDNGMKKLFGSNLSATTNTSFSASVKVPTGSYSELKEYPAIAQDMLFPSDATCPKEDECETFLTSVGGGSNAFVDKIHKDFFFEMVSSNVVPVLERLVAFFIAPTFVTRASSLDQINREFNKFGKHLTNATALSNTSILLSPEILDVMNPDVSPEPNLVATKPNSQGPVSERLCEHMLFPSNAKCPKEDEYETFLTSVGGGSNAFMDKIHKDFFFRVVSSKVVPVLERLVAFFIAPTFVTRASSLDPVNRERNVLAEPVANTPASQSPDAMAVGTKLTCNLNDLPSAGREILHAAAPLASRDRLVAHIIEHSPLCGTDGSRPNTASAPFLSTAVGGTGLYRNSAGESTVDSCAICCYAACTRAERNSMTAEYGLRKGGVFTIALEELFITSTIWDADVKYSFPYDQTNASEDTAGDPIKAAADLDGVPWELVECFDLAFVLLRLASFVWAICASRRRSGPNGRFANQTHRNQRFALALLVFVVVPRSSAMATTAPPNGDGTGAHRAESALMPPSRPPPPTPCADDVNSGALDLSGASMPCSYFLAQPSVCASYSIARTTCPVACGTCPPPLPDPSGMTFMANAETSDHPVAGMHAVQHAPSHRRAQQAQAGVVPSLTSTSSTSAGSSLVTAPSFPQTPLPPSSASRTPRSRPPPLPPWPPSPPRLMPPPTPSLYPLDSGPTPPQSSSPYLPIPQPSPYLPIPQPSIPPPPPVRMFPQTPLMPNHRRELQTAVSTSAGLLSALANTGVGRIVLDPGTYFLNAELSVTRSVVIEAAVAGSVVLDAQASSSSRRRVLYINPGSLGVVQLIGLNTTRGYVQGVRGCRRDLLIPHRPNGMPC